MKRLFVIGCLFLPLMSYAEQDIGVNVPEWSDFAPTAFVNVKEPKGLGKLNTTAKYWYGRRVEFETAISECKEMQESDKRFDCYEKLKVEQYKLNNDYNAKLEADMQNASSIPGMGSAMDNMLPLDNYLNTMTRFMPNEVR